MMHYQLPAKVRDPFCLSLFLYLVSWLCHGRTWQVLFFFVDLTRYHIVLKKLQQEAAAAKEEEEAREEAETTSDVPENVSIRLYSVGLFF